MPSSSTCLTTGSTWRLSWRRPSARLPILKRVPACARSSTVPKASHRMTAGCWARRLCCETSSSLPVQLRRHPVRRRRRQGDRGMDARGRADDGPNRLRHPPHAFRSRPTRPISSIASAKRWACTMPTSFRTAVRLTARGVRHSPLHDRLVAQRRLHSARCLAGSGRVWFLPEAARARGETAEYRYSWGRQNWFAYAAAEHEAVRTGVGLLDLSTFGKIRVEGRDALDVLQLVCANDVAVAPGTDRLHAMAQSQRRCRGRCHRLAAGRACVPGRHADGSLVRDLAWLKRHIPGDAHCVATDVTAVRPASA